MNAMTCRVRLEIEQLEARVRGRLAGRVRHLQLLGREDGLILKGQSPTYYGKQLAQHAVMEACEVPIVANEIEVWR
jgi:hypothetical protein